MDKVKVFLEKHVQWIALAIGGAIFMWALWTYVLNPTSVAVEVGGDEVGPAEVDDRILATSGSGLRARIEGQPAPIPNPPDLTAEIIEKIEFAGLQAPQLPSNVVPTPTPLPDFELSPDGMDRINVASLPDVPPALIIAVDSGRSYAQVPVEGAVDPEDPNATVQTELEDISYAIVRFEIPIAPIREEFGAAALPERSALTSILDVQLVRERRLPDGTWGERTNVPRLRNFPRPEGMPDESATLTEKQQYAAWAKENPEWIVQPPFYVVESGDEPQYLALSEDEVDAVEDEPFTGPGLRPGFDPLDRRTWPDDLSQLTDEEREAIRNARRNRNNNGQPGPGGPYGPDGGPYGPGGGQGGPYGPYGPYGPGGGDPYGGPSSDAGATSGNGNIVVVQNRQGGGNRTAPQGGAPSPESDPYGPEGFGPYGPYGPYGPEGGPEGPYGPYGPYGPGGMGMGGRPGQPGAYSAGAVPGEFNPASVEENIEGWAYDETAVPGETYRYNVIYSLRNPVFDTQNIADDPELESQLAITVDPDQTNWSENWSEPIGMESLARWFMRSVLPGENGDVRFEVFRWQKGRWQSKTFNVGPGDELGEVDGDIDYRTGRVLVDIREHPSSREKVAVLMDDEGRFTIHDAAEDESPAYEELETEASLASAGP